MTWVAEVTADSPAWWAHLAETSGTSAADQIGRTAGTYTGGYTLNQGSLLNAAAGDRGIALDGRSGYVAWADEASLDLGDVFTIECWVLFTAFRDSAGNPAVCIDKGGNAYILRQSNSLDGTMLLRRNGVADICTSTVRLALNTVYHVVATKNGATAKLYVNGVDVTSARSNSTMTNNTNALGVGVSDITVGGINGFLPGRIDECVLYSTALSSTRVLAHYNAGVQVFGSVAVSGGGSTAGSGQKNGSGTASVSGAGSVRSAGSKKAAGRASVSGGGNTTGVGKKGGRGFANATGGGSTTVTGIRPAHVEPPTSAAIVDRPTSAAVQGPLTQLAIDPAGTSLAITGRTTSPMITSRTTSPSIAGRSTGAGITFRTTTASIHA